MICHLPLPPPLAIDYWYSVFLNPLFLKTSFTSKFNFLERPALCPRVRPRAQLRGGDVAASGAKIPFLLPLFLSGVLWLFPGPKPPTQFFHFLDQPLARYTEWNAPKYLGEASQSQYTVRRRDSTSRFFVFFFPKYLLGSQTLKNLIKDRGVFI